MSQKSQSKLKRRRISTEGKKRIARVVLNSTRSPEDSKNLTVLSSIAATATNSAHKRAVLRADQIVYVEDNKVIRKEKGRHVQIIEELSPRKANKGDILYLKNF